MTAYEVAKSTDAGKELCEALGIDYKSVYLVVVAYRAGDAVKVLTQEFAEQPDGDNRMRKVIREEHDDLVRIMRDYELVEKGVEEI